MFHMCLNRRKHFRSCGFQTIAKIFGPQVSVNMSPWASVGTNDFTLLDQLMGLRLYKWSDSTDCVVVVRCCN